MRPLLLGLLVLIASIFIGLQIAADPGVVVLSWRNWSIETPLWFAILCFIAFFALMHYLSRFFSGIGASWHAFGSWLRLRRKKKACGETYHGLTDLIKGEWKKAEDRLLKSAAESDAPFINYLGAAKAAHERKTYDLRNAYIEKAYTAAPSEHIAIGLVHAEFQIDQGQVEQALATLNELHHAAPKQRRVLELLERLYIHLGDWNSLLKLLPALRKAKFADRKYLKNLEKTVHDELSKGESR